MPAPTPALAPVALVLHVSHGEFLVRKLVGSYPGTPVITTNKSGHLAVLGGPKIRALIDLPRVARAVVWVGVPAAWARDQLGAGKGTSPEAMSGTPYVQLTHTFVGRRWGEVKEEERIRVALGHAEAMILKRVKRAQEKRVAAAAALDQKVEALARQWRRSRPPAFFVPQELR